MVSMPRLRSLVVNTSLWLVLLGASYLLAWRVAWDLFSPWGAWRIPHIRLVHSEQLLGPASPIEFTSRLGGPGIPAERRLAIPLTEAGEVLPEQPKFFMDCYYLADNQPNMYRATPWRVIKGYPEVWFAGSLWMVLWRRRRRKTSMSGEEGSAGVAPPTETDLIEMAYCAYSKWGPSLRLPPTQRILQTLPKTPPEVAAAWVLEFQALDKAIWVLVNQGGSFKLGDEEVTRQLQADFPFLRKRGLKQALHEVNWHAWHEGLDK